MKPTLILLAFFLNLLALIQPVLAKPAPAELLLEGRQIAQTGFITKADASKIYFSASPSGNNEIGYPRAQVARLTFKQPEGWLEAEEARLAGEFEKAASLYDGIATDYRNVDMLEVNYGSLARLNQLECFRHLGAYSKLAAKRPLLKKSGLSEKYHAQVDLFVGWGTLADLSTPAKVNQLERLVNDYREAELLPGQLAQAFYLSAVANEKSGHAGKALTDYHRVFTLDFGADRRLAQRAMESALLLYAAEDKIYKDRQRLEEAHGLAQVFTRVFGDLPAKASQFAGPLPPLEEEDEG